MRVGPGWVILRQQKSGCMGRELADGEPAHIAARFEFWKIFADRIVQLELTLLDASASNVASKAFRPKPD